MILSCHLVQETLINPILPPLNLEPDSLTISTQQHLVSLQESIGPEGNEKSIKTEIEDKKMEIEIENENKNGNESESEKYF